MSRFLLIYIYYWNIKIKFDKIDRFQWGGRKTFLK
jgi:hypothetical protein